MEEYTDIKKTVSKILLQKWFENNYFKVFKNQNPKRNMKISLESKRHKDPYLHSETLLYQLRDKK